MRRTLVGAASAALLAVSALPAVAGGATRVDGAHFERAGLRIATQGCLDPMATPAVPPTAKVINEPSPPRGTHAVGWVPAEQNFATGPTALIKAPTTASGLRVIVYSPDASTTPVAVATYVAPGDTGVWRGTAVLPEDRRLGWHQVDASGVDYYWRHYTAAGANDISGPSATLRDHALRHGGDGDGAWIGILHGCDGDPFYIDSLTASSSTETMTYDFGGYRTRTTILAGDRSARTARITYGERVDLVTRLRQVTDDSGLKGQVRIDYRPLARKKFTKLKTVRTTTAGNHRLEVRPGKSTAYRATYRGADVREGSQSATLKVLVGANVRARLRKGTVTAGRTFTVTGQVYPKRAVSYSLQKYIDGEWRTVRKSTSRRDGSYSVGMKAPRPGKSYWRIRASGGPGLVAGNSVWLKLRSEPKPAPPPSGGGGGSTPQPEPEPTNPTPPPPAEPPPPPPPGPLRPTVG